MHWIFILIRIQLIKVEDNMNIFIWGFISGISVGIIKDIIKYFINKNKWAEKNYLVKITTLKNHKEGHNEFHTI